MSNREISVSVVLMAVWLGSAAWMASRPLGNERSRKEATMRRQERNIQVMLEIFRAIEVRDPNHENVQRQRELFQPDVEFHWPPSLPYGGTFRGATRRSGDTWGSTWTPLQPTAAERRMDPRVIGATGDEVVVYYHQRGISPAGEKFDGEVVGVYQLRDYKLARAQMFYFDEAAACRFLKRASGGRATP